MDITGPSMGCWDIRAVRGAGAMATTELHLPRTAKEALHVGSPRREVEKVLGMLNREMEVETQWTWVSVGMGSSVHDACQHAVHAKMLLRLDSGVLKWGLLSLKKCSASRSHGCQSGQVLSDMSSPEPKLLIPW